MLPRTSWIRKLTSNLTGGNLRTIERLANTQQGGSVHNYGFDRLGSVTAMTSTSGSLVNSYRYDPWGQPNGGTGTAYNPFQYTGTYKDTMTGLYQMGARYYQPGSGRFTQLDPKPEKLLTFNRYEYAGSNPCNFADPTGLDHCGFWQEMAAWGGYAVALGVGIQLVLTLPAATVMTAGSWLGLALAIGAAEVAAFQILDCAHAPPHGNGSDRGDEG